MWLLIIEFFALAAVVAVAGTFLARFGDAIGELTGMGRTLAGLLLLALATSLPELALDCSAALQGAADLAVGDLFGSSLFNLLILATLDLTFRTGGRMLSHAAAAHAISATMAMVLTGMALLFLQLRLDWTPLGHVGMGSLAIGVTYVLLLRLVYFDQLHAARETPVDAPLEEPPDYGDLSLRRAIVGYIAATAVIFASAPLLAMVADRLAEESGLGRTFVGTTLVALSTSLPEMVTTLAAVRMRAYDLAVGNILGSNSFNMAILIGVDLFYAEPLYASVSQTHALTATAVIIITAVAMMGLLYRGRRRYRIIEPDALLVVLLVLGALTMVYYAG